MTRSSTGTARIRKRLFFNSLDAREDVLKAVIATSLDGLPGLRDEWLSLRKRRGVLTTWAHPDRFLAELCASPNGVEPHVVVFRNEHRPRALIVGRTSRRRIVCALGYWKLYTPELRCLDVAYGGLISDGTRVARHRVITYLNSLLHQKHVDLIVVNHLPVNHELYEPLRKVGAVHRVTEPHWRLTLTPGSYEDTISRFSKKHRYNMRRADRLLVEHFGGDVLLRVFDRAEQLNEFVQGAADVAAKTYQAGMAVGFSGSPLWRALLRDDAGRGRLRCYWLECRGLPIAFQVGVVYNGVYFLEFTGYLPEHAALSPGTVLLVRVVQDLCAAGVREVDYGFGDAEYKRIYGTYSWDEATLLFCGQTFRARLALLMGTCATSASNIASRWARRAGLLSWVKRKWRARLQARTSIQDKK